MEWSAGFLVMITHECIIITKKLHKRHTDFRNKFYLHLFTELFHEDFSLIFRRIQILNRKYK